MPKITIHADCGDVPKKALLRDLNIAYARSDVEAILDFFTDDIRWHIVGEFEMRGVDQVRQALLQMKDVKARELVIDSIITQGGEGVISGSIIPENGKPVAFCDVCRFAAGEKIKSIKSFTVELNDGGLDHAEDRRQSLV